MSRPEEEDPARALSGEAIEDLRARLCRWFVEHARDLPWRRAGDPYSTWISEAMLQQTRVEAVLDHYRRFLARFPDSTTLAAASEDDVIAAWSGLGYYRRARALWEAARVIVAEHSGELPGDREALLALPGVGRYTAGAILSIAFGRSEPLVDGNVARVFSRLFLLEAPLGTSVMDRELWSLAARLVPPEVSASGEGVVSPGCWNEGLMELGALLCTARKPGCPDCPLSDRCAARAAGRQIELPARRPRRAPVDVALEVLLVRRGDDVLVRRRPARGRMAGMWELPTREVTVEGTPPRLWPETHSGVDLRAGRELGTISHSITHHRIRATVRDGALAAPVAEDRATRWIDPAELGQLATTGMTRKILRRHVARGD